MGSVLFASTPHPVLVGACKEASFCKAGQEGTWLPPYTIFLGSRLKIWSGGGSGHWGQLEKCPGRNCAFKAGGQEGHTR